VGVVDVRHPATEEAAEEAEAAHLPCARITVAEAAVVAAR